MLRRGRRSDRHRPPLLGAVGTDAEQGRPFVGAAGVGVRAERGDDGLIGAVAVEYHRHGVAGLERAHHLAEVVVGVDGDPVDRQDHVAGQHAGGGRRGVVRHHADLGAGCVDEHPADGEHAEEQHGGDGDVHHRSGADDEQPLRVALLPIGARLVGGIDLVEVVHPDDAHEGAERQQAHAVLGLAALEAPQARPEADEELGDLHARRPGGEVVTGLVQEDRHEDADQEHEHPHVGHGEPGDEGEDAQPGDQPGHATTGRVAWPGLVLAAAAGGDLVLEAVDPRPRRGRRHLGRRPGGRLLVALHAVSRAEM